MTFANPAALLGLLFIPAVVLLYFLKLKRRSVLVSSTLLWSRVLEDRRVNSPFQRFRRSLLLLLQILAILFFVGALAKPEMITENVPGRANLIMIDVSASMSVIEEGRTRLERAQRLAIEYVEAMGADERAVIIRFASRAEAITPMTSDRSLLRRAIDSLEIVPAPTDLDDAMQLASSIAKNLGASPLDQVENITVIFSDGGFPVWESEEVPLLVDYVKIGERADNSGIVALASRVDFAESTTLQVYVEVKNFGPDPAEGFVSILRDGVEVRAAEAQLASGEKWSRSFETEFTGGVLTVVWKPDGDDALELDNRAWLEIAPRRNLLIWRVGDDNLFLDEAINAIPTASSEFVAASEVTTKLEAGGAEPDLIIWDRIVPEVLPTGVNHLFFAGVPPGVWESTPVVQFPPIVSWDRSHPVNRYVNYSLLDESIESSLILGRLPNTKLLVETSAGGVIASFALPGTRGIVVGFDSLRSSWPLDLSWPFFLFNAIQHLGANESNAGTGVRAEELISLRMRGNKVQNAKVTRPSAKSEELPIDAFGWIRYQKTNALGPYRFEWEEPDRAADTFTTREHFVPVNLLWARESSVAPRETLELSGSVVESSEARGVFRREFWPWVVALALALVLVEWYFYHRR